MTAMILNVFYIALLRTLRKSYYVNQSCNKCNKFACSSSLERMREIDSEARLVWIITLFSCKLSDQAETFCLTGNRQDVSHN